MNWTPIARENPEVRGIDPQAPGLLDVTIRLRPTPPREWVELFEHPPGVSISMAMHPPRLSGATVRIRPPDDELEAYLAHVDQRIDAANREFEERFLPQIRARAAREAQNTEQERLRIEEAKRKAQDL